MHDDQTHSNRTVTKKKGRKTMLNEMVEKTGMQYGDAKEAVAMIR
jgi:hypothetical protein